MSGAEESNQLQMQDCHKASKQSSRQLLVSGTTADKPDRATELSLHTS